MLCFGCGFGVIDLLLCSVCSVSVLDAFWVDCLYFVVILLLCCLVVVLVCRVADWFLMVVFVCASVFSLFYRLLVCLI